MARYNTSGALVPAGANNGVNLSISSATVLSTPLQGTFYECTGTAPYQVTLPSPSAFYGIAMTFYNTTGGVVTLSTPSNSFVGAIVGTAASTFLLPTTGSLCTVISDGTNYIVTSGGGVPVAASTLSANSTVTLSPTNASVIVSPTGSGTVTISPATTGSISNVTGSFTGFSNSGLSTFQQIQEVMVSTASPGTIPTLNYATGDLFYLTGLTGNFVPNFSNVPTTGARSTTITLFLIQGGTAYIPTSIQINGTGYPITWPGGVTPTGRANKVDIATLILLNPAGSFTNVLGQYGSFG